MGDSPYNSMDASAVVVGVSNAHSWTCMDIYVFATPYRVTWDYYFISCEHTLEFDKWGGKAEYEYVKPCKICGDVGVPEAIITCSCCKTTREHLVDLFIDLGDEIGAEMGDEVGAFGGLKMVGLGDEVGLKWVG
ncbi:hypothetical protein Tco_1215455 [Tanacetum coccineum]